VFSQSCCAFLQVPFASIASRWASVRRRMATPEETPPGPTVACAPCRGTGTVISNLGATAQEVTCPWCEGGGIQLPGHDAQQARVAAAAATQP
jgi:hypothetical protein